MGYGESTRLDWQFKRFKQLDNACPICGRLVMAKFYDEHVRAWRFKHQRAMPNQDGRRRSLKRETYYCEAKAVG